MPFYVEYADARDEWVHSKFEPEFPIEKKRPLIWGSQLTQEQKDEIPRTLLVSEPGRKGLPDILGWLGGPWVFSQRLRDKLEELEPGVHEFIPMQVKREDTLAECGTYYLVLLTQALDAVIIEETRFRRGVGAEAAKKSAYMFNLRERQIMLRADVIRGRHFWRGTGELWDSHFCSDELGQYIIQNELWGWDLWDCQVKEYPDYPDISSGTKSL